jgi:protein SCO1
MKKWGPLLLLFVVPALICGIFYYIFIHKPFAAKNSATFKTLPYFGPKEAKAPGDTLYHVIPSFSLINQDGKTFTDKDLEGKIYVADFFFVTCKTICPKMTASLFVVQDKLKHIKDFAILSHTVDPESDSVPVLKDYAMKVHAMPGVWNFVTGNKKEIYDLARYGYYVNALEGDGGPDDFIHSELFILVDKEKHIRGIYDGTKVADIERLVDEVTVLETQYRFNESKHE